MSISSSEQLRRILQLIPSVADGAEHSIPSVVERLGLKDANELMSDLSSLVERFDSGEGFSDGIQICLDDSSVSVFAPHFLRPMRLTMAELCTLELGLAILRAERLPDEHGVIEQARARLKAAVTTLPENDMREGVLEASIAATGGDLAHLATLRSAYADRQKATLTYRGAETEESKVRTICPYGFVFSSGMWYIIAHCESSNGIRFFRLDRIEEVVVTDLTYDKPPVDAMPNLVDGVKPLHGTSNMTMRIRYSPRIARWIAEREGAELSVDKSLTLEHPVHDLGWAVRHVLQYGPDATVEAPEQLRRLVTEQLREMVA